jgi:hypothetical protein
MPIFNSASQPEVHYLFVDGAYLRGALKSIQARWLPEAQLAWTYAGLGAHAGASFTKVFYYDCIAPKSQDESDDAYRTRVQAQEAFFNSIRSLRGWHVIEGVIKRNGKRSRQKEIDVLSAVDMLTHTHRRNMQRATFIAGDQDFRPLIEAVVRDGMFVEVWYERSSVSSDLLDSADDHRELDLHALHSVLTPDLQRRYQLPNAYITLGKELRVANLQQTGEDGSELYEQQGSYLLIRPDPSSVNSFLHVLHPDKAFLMLYHENTFGPTAWRSAA